MEMVAVDIDPSKHFEGMFTDSSSGTVFRTSSQSGDTQIEDGVKVFNLDKDIVQRVQGADVQVAQSYTHCAWIKWRDSHKGWRTLFRGTHDHSVLVKNGGTELGMFSNRKGQFQGSGYHIELGSFQLVCVVGKGETSVSPLGESAFFVGSMSDAPRLVGSVERVVSGTKVFRIGWPGQGPGKLARFTKWNVALTMGQLNEFWSLSRPVVKDLMTTAVSDLSASQSNKATIVDAHSGTVFDAPQPIELTKKWDGIKVWDLEKRGFFERSGGPQWTVAQSYTHCAWVKWRKSNKGWRTLFRGNADHSVLVKDGSTELGMFSNRQGGFRGSGYHIKTGTFQLVCVVGEGIAPHFPFGFSKFFVGSVSEAPSMVGNQVDRVVSGTKVNRIGWPGQGPGKLNRFTAWNYALSPEQLQEYWSKTNPHGEVTA